MSDKETGWISPQLLEVLKQNTYMSPETWRLVNNPVWAYIRTKLKPEENNG